LIKSTMLIQAVYALAPVYAAWVASPRAFASAPSASLREIYRKAD